MEQDAVPKEEKKEEPDALDLLIASPFTPKWARLVAKIMDKQARSGKEATFTVANMMQTLSSAAHERWRKSQVV